MHKFIKKYKVTVSNVAAAEGIMPAVSYLPIRQIIELCLCPVRARVSTTTILNILVLELRLVSSVSYSVIITSWTLRHVYHDNLRSGDTGRVLDRYRGLLSSSNTWTPMQ